MSENLLADISAFTTPEVILKIANGTAIDPTHVQKLVSNAVPALLTQFGDLARTPQGATRLSQAVAAQDPALMDDLARSLGEEQQVEIAQKGSDQLASLIGANKLQQLTNSLALNSNIDADTSQSIIGLLGPVILGAIGRTDPSNWTDANAIAGLFGAKSPVPPATTGATPVMADNTMPPAQTAQPTSHGSMMWLWIVLIVMIAALALWFWMRNAK